MYDVLVNDLRRSLISDAWYSIVGFKTYAQAKTFVRKEINSKYCFVYIRKLSKQNRFVPRWRSIHVFSTEYYRLEIQSMYISNLLDDRFKTCLRRFFHATK